MRCKKSKEMLALFAGGDTTYDEGEAVKEHIITCRECASEADAYRQSLRTLRRLKECSLPSDFWDGYNDEIWRRISIRPPGARRKFRITPRHISNAFAIAAALLLGFTFAWPFIYGVDDGGNLGTWSLDTRPHSPTFQSSTGAEYRRYYPLEEYRGWNGNRKYASDEWFHPLEVRPPEDI